MSIINRRIRQLIIPFLVWSLILILINPPYHLESFIDVFLYPQIWFLWVLFWITALFYLGDYIAGLIKVKQELIIVILCFLLALIMILGDVRVLGFQFIAFYFLFFSLGYYINKYDKRLSWSTWFLIPLALVWAVLAWFWRMHGVPSFLQGLPLPVSLMEYGYRFITASIAVYVLFGVCRRYLNYPEGKDKMLIYVGQWSLGIYTIHLLLMPFVCDVIMMFDLPNFLKVLFAFIISFFSSLVLVVLLSKNRVTKRIMLGKI